MQRVLGFIALALLLVWLAAKVQGWMHYAGIIP